MGDGGIDLIASIELIENHNTNEENMREIPNIDVFDDPNPNLLFHS